MQKQYVNQLDYKERQWLYRAVLRMIVADKVVDKAELCTLKECLTSISNVDLKDCKDIINSVEFRQPLKPIGNIKYDHAVIILLEIARIAAIDSRIVIEETEMLKDVLSLMNFSESAINKVINWAKKLAAINKEEEELRNELKELYKIN